jgi:hypothetical protein
LAEQGRSAAPEGSFLDRNRSAWTVLEATVAAAVVVEVVGIVDVVEVVLVVGMVVDIGVEVVDAVDQAENTTLGSRVEVQRAQSRVADAQGERRDFVAEEGRIAEVVVYTIVVVAGEVCWELAAGVGIESIVVGTQRQDELAEGRAVEGKAVGHIAGAG